MRYGIILLLVLASLCAQAQSPAEASGGWRHFFAASHPEPDGPRDRSDPGYQLYRKGYGEILDQEWDAALATFRELVGKHPRSPYAGDALYWSAYALTHVNPGAAVEAYRDFLGSHPDSRFFDDAVADLGMLDPAARLIPGVAPRVPAPADAPGDLEIVIGPAVKRAERALRRLTFDQARMRYRIALPRDPLRIEAIDTMDQTVRLRAETVYALGGSRDDSRAMKTLKNVALDGAQPTVVREAALEALGRFPERDALEVLVTVAQADTSSRLQTLSIDLIGEYPGDRDRRVETLVGLYRRLPDSRREQRESIFFAIADIGNDRAVDFLRTVALTSEDYTRRRAAVYYLGGIGSERARSALVEILEAK